MKGCFLIACIAFEWCPAGVSCVMIYGVGFGGYDSLHRLVTRLLSLPRTQYRSSHQDATVKLNTFRPCHVAMWQDTDHRT